MLPALAGIVHDRQSAHYQYRQGENDQYGSFHCGPRRCGPQTLPVTEFSSFKNELAVNARMLLASNRRADRLETISIGNSAQYHYDNKYKGERHANRFYNRMFVAHNRYLGLVETI